MQTRLLVNTGAALPAQMFRTVELCQRENTATPDTSLGNRDVYDLRIAYQNCRGHPKGDAEMRPKGPVLLRNRRGGLASSREKRERRKSPKKYAEQQNLIKSNKFPIIFPVG
jgi:hypothetical protein